MKYAWVYSICIGMCLSGVALWRGEFSIDLISVPMQAQAIEMDGAEALQILNQPYRFLAKGRQSFVFESEDGKWVVKFFNNKYLKMPWYSFALWNQEKEKLKRKRRQLFYLESYSLANHHLKEQTEIVYLHNGTTHNLPTIQIQDQTNHTFMVNLNTIPFVLQKKGTLFCQSLKTMPTHEIHLALHQFFKLIAIRISKGVADADHDIEHNFGYLNGKVFHLDPGRLFVDDLSNPARQAHEWWSATHNLRKWLKINAPQYVPDFDREIASWENSTSKECPL